MGKVGSPQRHDTVLVIEMHDGVVLILCHGAAGACFRAVFRDDRIGLRVLVFEVPGVSLSKKYARENERCDDTLTTLASN